MNDLVFALTVHDGALIAGGAFTAAGGAAANYIARWDGTSWQPLGGGMNGVVNRLIVRDGELIAGGQFTTAAGRVSAYVARWSCACLGDANCDGAVTFADIDPFVARLGCPSSNPASCAAGCQWQNADVNADGSVTFADIDPFVARLGAVCP